MYTTHQPSPRYQINVTHLADCLYNEDIYRQSAGGLEDDKALWVIWS